MDMFKEYGITKEEAIDAIGEAMSLITYAKLNNMKDYTENPEKTFRILYKVYRIIEND